MDANGNGFASLIWVYIVFPLIGAITAAIWFRIHIWMDNKALEGGGAPPAQPVAGVSV